MTRRATILLAGLAIAAVVWSQTSVLSPSRGWANRIIGSAVGIAYRLSASAPCSECPTRSVVIGGVKVTHPAYLGTVLWTSSEPRGGTFAVVDRWHRCGLAVTVHSLADEDQQRLREKYRSRHNIVRHRKINNWDVLFESGEGTAIATAHVFGPGRLVTIGAIVDARVANTELSAWIEHALHDVVTALCEQNGSTSSGEKGPG